MHLDLYTYILSYFYHRFFIHSNSLRKNIVIFNYLISFNFQFINLNLFSKNLTSTNFLNSLNILLSFHILCSLNLKH